MDAELDRDPLIGEVLDERYRIEAELGRGAMGVVYRARHVKIGRAVAVKVLHHRLVDTPKMIERFEREANAAAKLRHQNLVGVLDVGALADGRRTMVLELAMGPSLADVVGTTPMPPARVIAMLRQICDGLDEAHRAGLIHRDLKPENIVVETAVDGTDVPRIIDFGIAILRDGAGDVTPRLTDLGMVLGTPAYMSPEQATGAPLDHRCDLFALGVIAYEMLAGQVPFEGTGVEVIHANVMYAPPPIAVRSPGVVVEPWLEAIVLRLMAKRPDDRFASARAVRDALVAPEPAPIVAEPIVVPPIAVPVARRRGIAIAIAAVIVVAVATIALTRSDPPSETVAPVIVTPLVPAPAPAIAIAVPIPIVPVAPVAPVAPPPPSPPIVAPRPPPPPRAIVRPTPPPPPAIVEAEITPRQLTDRYIAIGRVLAHASDAQRIEFRAIQLNDALASPASRRAAMNVLDRLGAAIPP